METIRRVFSFDTLISIYLLGFLFTLHHTLPVYINSSFLSATFGEKFVGAMYMLGSGLTVLSFFSIPTLLRKYGEYKTAMLIILVNLLSMFGLILANHSFLIALSFIVNFTSATLIAFNLDILLEHNTAIERTGNVRGTYLTLANIAWLIAPLIATSILKETTEYWRIYTASFLFLIPVIYILRHKFKDFQDPPYQRISLGNALRSLARNKDNRMIFMAAFLMQLFFSWMVIYIPLYLHDHIGFAWSEIGLILSIALLPYILLETPLGRLADSRLGEKELLSMGFIIVGLSTIALSFITSAHFALWAAVLFVTRVGGSMLEIMTDTYFFKVVDRNDVDALSFFRMTRPLAYIVGPLLASGLLLITNFQIMFFILGLIMLYGIRYSIAITDTR